MNPLDRWIESWKSGDEAAAEALFNACRSQVFRLAYGLLGEAGDAEEAAQDALTYALTHIQAFDARQSQFTTWLHTITVSRCRDLQRKRRRFSLFAWLQPEHDLPDPAPQHEQRLLQEELRSEVWQAVQALPDTLREAVILRYWAGHTYREMGEILKCPLPTTQARVRLAYQRLRSALAATPADLSAFEEEEAC